MKWLVTLIIAVTLSGCQIFAFVRPPFPKAGEEQMKSCDDLKRFENKEPGGAVDMIYFQQVIVENYLLYYKCSDKTDTWINWYTDQKRIYEGGKK